LLVENKKSGEFEKNYIGTKTASVASFMVFGKFIVFLISGITFILVARLLGPSVYGIYTLAFAFSSFFSVVADIGVNTTVSKFIAEYIAKKNKKELDKVVSNSYYSILITGIIFTIIAFSMSGFIASHVLNNAGQTYILQIVSLCILGALLFNVSYSTLVGFGNGSYVAIIVVIQSIFQSAVSLYFVVAGFGALGPILGLLVGYLMSVLATLFIIRKKLMVNFVKPSISYIKDLLTFSYAIAVYNGLRGFINNLGPILLAVYATTTIVGNFGVAIKITALISDIASILGAASLPMFAYTLSTKNIGKSIGKFYNYAAYSTFLVAVPILLYLSILSKEFSYTVFSAKYAIAPMYISIMSLGVLLWVLATYTNMLLLGANKVKEIMKYSIIIAVIELIVLFTVVPKFGGIALVLELYILSPTLIILFMSRAVRKYLDTRLEVFRLIRVVIAGVISVAFLVPVIILLKGDYIPILIVGALEQMIVYPIMIGLTGATNMNDINVIREITKKVPIVNKVIPVFAAYAEHFIKLKNKFQPNYGA
jgi:O-antigen/teichoic acid export membrane protein